MESINSSSTKSLHNLIQEIHEKDSELVARAIGTAYIDIRTKNFSKEKLAAYLFPDSRAIDVWDSSLMPRIEKIVSQIPALKDYTIRFRTETSAFNYPR